MDKFYLTAAIGGLSLLCLCIFWSQPSALLLILSALSILLFLPRRTKAELILFFTAVIGGGLSEMAAVYFGAYHYAMPDLFNIPYWICVLWGIAAVFIARYSEFLKKNYHL